MTDNPKYEVVVSNSAGKELSRVSMDKPLLYVFLTAQHFDAACVVLKDEETVANITILDGETGKVIRKLRTSVEDITDETR